MQPLRNHMNWPWPGSRTISWIRLVLTSLRLRACKRLISSLIWETLGRIWIKNWIRLITLMDIAHSVKSRPGMSLVHQVREAERVRVRRREGGSRRLLMISIGLLESRENKVWNRLMIIQHMTWVKPNEEPWCLITGRVSTYSGKSKAKGNLTIFRLLKVANLMKKRKKEIRSWAHLLLVQGRKTNINQLEQVPRMVETRRLLISWLSAINTGVTITNKGHLGQVPDNLEYLCNNINSNQRLNINHLQISPHLVNLISLQMNQFWMNKPNSREVPLFIPASIKATGKISRSWTQDHQRSPKVAIDKTEAYKIYQAWLIATTRKSKSVLRCAIWNLVPVINKPRCSSVMKGKGIARWSLQLLHKE